MKPKENNSTMEQNTNLQNEESKDLSKISDIMHSIKSQLASRVITAFVSSAITAAILFGSVILYLYKLPDITQSQAAQIAANADKIEAIESTLIETNTMVKLLLLDRGIIYENNKQE